MSRKPETVFIASVHKHLPKSLYRIKNNNPFAGGQADCWYSGPRADLWIEYKFVPRLSQMGIKADLSQLQLQWLRDRYMEGRNVAVIVGCKEGGFILRDLAWENAISPEQYALTLQPRTELARWIQRETGAQNDQERSGNLPNTRRASARRRQQPADLRGPIRRPARQSAGTQPQPRQ